MSVFAHSLHLALNLENLRPQQQQRHVELETYVHAHKQNCVCERSHEDERAIDI